MITRGSRYVGLETQATTVRGRDVILMELPTFPAVADLGDRYFVQDSVGEIDWDEVVARLRADESAYWLVAALNADDIPDTLNITVNASIVLPAKNVLSDYETGDLTT